MPFSAWRAQRAHDREVRTAEVQAYADDAQRKLEHLEALAAAAHEATLAELKAQQRAEHDRVTALEQDLSRADAEIRVLQNAVGSTVRACDLVWEQIDGYPKRSPSSAHSYHNGSYHYDVHLYDEFYNFDHGADQEDLPLEARLTQARDLIATLTSRLEDENNRLTSLQKRRAAAQARRREQARLEAAAELEAYRGLLAQPPSPLVLLSAHKHLAAARAAHEGSGDAASFDFAGARADLERLASSPAARELRCRSLLAEALGLTLTQPGHLEVLDPLMREEVLVRLGSPAGGGFEYLLAAPSVLRLPSALLAGVRRGHEVLEVLRVTETSPGDVETLLVLLGDGLPDLPSALEAAQAL